VLLFVLVSIIVNAIYFMLIMVFQFIYFDSKSSFFDENES